MIITWSRDRRGLTDFSGSGLIGAFVGVASSEGAAAGPTFEIRIETDLFDMTDDVLAPGGLQLSYGITGNRPDDCVAGTGQLQWTLDNSETNSSLQLGYYSPAHASKRTGWTFGIPARVIFTHLGVEYQKFTGKIREIVPEPGSYGTRRVRVTAYDGIRDLAESDAREVAIQVNKTEAELIDALLDAVPSESQPMSRDLDTGVDVFPIAFDDLEGGASALSVIRDVTVSSLGRSFIKGDGEFRYVSRHALELVGSQHTFDNDMNALVVPSTLDGVFNHIRATNHPKVISPTAIDVLYELPDGNTIELAIGQTREISVDYTDPNDRETKIGGADVVEVLIPGTHYSANSVANGSGVDLTAGIVAVLSTFSSTATYTLTNNSGDVAHIVVLNVIGKAIRDPGPQTFQSVSTGSADRPFDLDMPYQDDPFVAQSAADYLKSLFSDLSHQVSSITFLASDSDALLLQALAREPGDKITISEAVSGLASVVALIHSVALDIDEHGHMWCTWGLAPASIFRTWQLGIVGRSELGQTTVLGF